MGKKRRVKKMGAAAIKPIRPMVIEMSEKDYTNFINYTNQKKPFSHTPAQQQAIERFKKHKQSKERK